MSTVGAVIDATLNRWLYGTYRTRTNVLNADVSDTTAIIPMQYTAKAVGEGSLIAIDDELMEVIATPAANDLTVIRGMRGTDAVPHTVPAAVEINPRYPRLSVRAAMLDEIESWPETLFAVTTFTDSNSFPSATIDASTKIAPAGVRRVLAVWRAARFTGSDDRWFPVDWSSAKGARGPGTCDIYLEKVPGSAQQFRIVVGTDFVTVPFADNTDLQAEVGVPRSAEDVLQMGAAWRLVMGHEAKRLYTEQQGESRDATEVGSLDIARFGAQLMNMRDAGVAREAKRLKDRFGVGITG